MTIKNDIQTLVAAAQLRRDIQPQLRTYVIDKKEPLNKRFRIWARFCDKDWHNTTDIDVTSRLADKSVDISGRCRVYQWDDFLLNFIDSVEHPEEIQEELIASNVALVGVQ